MSTHRIEIDRELCSGFGACADLDPGSFALGADGIAVKDDERFVAWLHATVRVFASDGQTLIGIDHLPMGEPGRLDPVGSFRKKAATTGSMFLATSPKPPTQERAGVIKLTTAKDRSGLWTKGETAAVVHLGPNGAGKTTTVEILEGFRDRDSGEVKVLGFDPATKGAAAQAWRDRIGIVLQSTEDAGDLTVYESVSHFAKYYKSFSANRIDAHCPSM